MWKRMAPLLIVLSVAMNVAFVGVWAVHTGRVQQIFDRSDNRQMWCPLHRRLDVADEQWRRIEPLLTDFQNRAQTICARMNRLRTELIDLIAVNDPDRQAIAAKQEEIRAGQQEMQQLVVEHLLAEKEMLTPQQQRALFDTIRKHSSCAGHSSMIGVRPFGIPQADLNHTGSSSHNERR